MALYVTWKTWFRSYLYVVKSQQYHLRLSHVIICIVYTHYIQTSSRIFCINFDFKQLDKWLIICIETSKECPIILCEIFFSFLGKGKYLSFNIETSKFLKEAKSYNLTLAVFEYPTNIFLIFKKSKEWIYIISVIRLFIYLIWNKFPHNLRHQNHFYISSKGWKLLWSMSVSF